MIRATNQLTGLNVSVSHTNVEASVTNMHSVLDDLVMEYVPKNKMLRETATLPDQVALTTTKPQANFLILADATNLITVKAFVDSFTLADSIDMQIYQQLGAILGITYFNKSTFG